jgi:hypothetical protein
VAEDIREAWATVLAVSDQDATPSWRLLSPDGVPMWAADGPVTSDELTSALDELLRPSRPAGVERIRPDLDVGARLGIDFAIRPCPPPPLARPGTAGSVLAFVERDRPSSRARLRSLAGAVSDADDAPFVMVVLDAADADEAEALRRELHPSVAVVADPSGAIARRAGVRVWPTTMRLDDLGYITGVELGADLGDRATAGRAD